MRHPRHVDGVVCARLQPVGVTHPFPSHPQTPHCTCLTVGTCLSSTIIHYHSLCSNDLLMGAKDAPWPGESEKHICRAHRPVFIEKSRFYCGRILAFWAFGCSLHRVPVSVMTKVERSMVLTFKILSRAIRTCGSNFIHGLSSPSSAADMWVTFCRLSSQKVGH